ncbi:cation:proton antiporter [bacterium]|nr:cation:proton antiporter [bacterium]
MFRSRPKKRRSLAELASRREKSIPKWVLITALVLVAPFCSDLFGPATVSGQETSQEATPNEEAALPGEATEAKAKEKKHDEGHDGDHSEEHGDEHGEHEEGHAGGHENVAAPLFAAIVMILLLAKIIGDLFERVGMPAVLGELSVGILLGNMLLITGMIPGIEPWDGLAFLKAPAEGSVGNVYSTGAALKMLAEIGVVLLLFEVGLESNVGDMMKVGVSSLLVAILGVVAPLLLGIGCGWMFLSDHHWAVWLFLGATLCATSVGITARVLKDLGRSKQRESQLILGAAVIDDVLGLIILTIVTGIITSLDQGEAFSMAKLSIIVLKAVGFLVAAVVLGGRIFVKPLFKMASFLRGQGLLVSTSLVICFGLAYLANLVGLAPIVGAFAAGLILEHAHYQELGKKEHVELEEALGPLTTLLVPIFFVQMGIMVSLQSFANPSVWLLAGAITVAAVIGKQVCSLGVMEKNLNKLAVGLGMIPRGEVGLIFANVGLALKIKGDRIVSDDTYSAIIVMVILTTMVTPPLLKWSLNKESSSPEPVVES